MLYKISVKNGQQLNNMHTIFPHPVFHTLNVMKSGTTDRPPLIQFLYTQINTVQKDLSLSTTQEKISA
jgi:hypothetical protein